MTELDRASATATADTTSPGPAGELRPGSRDSQARYPSAVSSADTNPGYYDGNIKAALAADATPTRQQAARDASADDHQASEDHESDGDIMPTSRDEPARGRDGDIEAILHEDDHLPEPRTRQQAARDDATSSGATESTAAAAHDTPGRGRDPDIEAILHENDHLPEPRTRQQAARDTADGSRATTDKDRAAATDQQPPPGPDPLARDASETTATTAELPDGATDSSPPSGRPDADTQTATVHDQAGHDVPVTIVQASPEMRTLGDDTPTGIGRKPDGGELEEMESDRLSRADRFRKSFYKQADDINDVTEKNANALESFLAHRPTGGEAAATGHPVIEAPQPPPADAGSIATGGLVLGILADRGIHWARQRMKRERE
jgi:hypothetical protein